MSKTTITDASPPSASSVCRRCEMSLDSSVKQEESVMKMASDLPSLWQTDQELLKNVLTDYSNLAKNNAFLKDQVAQLFRTTGSY